MIVKLLTEHHLEFLSLKGGYTGLSESTLLLSKYHIVGNHMTWLISFTQTMESDNAQMKIENDHLRDLVANARDKGERDKEALKKATRYYFLSFIIL